MATDWTSPKTSDTHTNELAATRGRDESNARMDYTGDTNIPDGTIRWNKTNNRFEIWNATTSTWSVLSSKYLINVDTVDGYHAGNASGNVPVSNGTVNTNLNADKLDGQHGTFFQARANHIGTQAPSTISPQGTGSGLDADKLDGQHGSYYVAKSGDTMTGPLNFSQITCQVKGQIWSRIVNIVAQGVFGSKFRLTVTGTRSSVVFSSVWDIATQHSRKGSLVCLTDKGYEPTRLRLVIDSNGNGYVEMLDTAWSIPYGTLQNINVSIISTLGTVTPITTFVDGTTIPTGYVIAADATEQENTISYNGNKIWHAGNDGSGSGLDADLLDGKHATSFVLTSDYENADVLAKVKAVDGAGSGLDADLLDGKHLSEIGGGIWDVIIEDRKPQNTAGGTFTSGAWRTRNLNTLVFNYNSLASLSNNRFTLPAGTYCIDWDAPAYRVDCHKTALYNYSASVIIAYGTSEFSLNSTGNAMNRSCGTVVITINNSTSFEIRHICGATYNTQGLGINTNLGTEVYTRVRIKKIS